MPERVECQPAYVLHSRPYKETSALVSFLTLDYGRIDGVARGVRRKNSRNRALLQSLQPLHISWRGASELKTLSDIEACGGLPLLTGRAVSCVLYANELINRLIMPGEAVPELFREYALLINQLQDKALLEPALRNFEWQLLASLGYPILFRQSSGKVIDPQGRYDYLWQSGFVINDEGIPGELLLALEQDDWSDPRALRAAKILNRAAIQPLLGDKPLLSRQLFHNGVHKAPAP
ncbi:DNA repair protein RecO [Oceanospirillum sediminis]|uniref:DNA repair protein RecO n=1 Tax=Oceanospirillum sediminis TaxID=2760088 RepID=A0A839IJR9_9GAMM|nr:DNA repair protein RecO [Oceanospirillum sediminis]MBB1485425.1 DNA repair protein RecO [Oceanospirillum sediminis]